jgi:hypothetical protein
MARLQVKITYQSLKLTQFSRKLKFTAINGYNMYGEWTYRLAHLITKY